MKNIFAICKDWLLSRFWHIVTTFGIFYLIALIDYTGWFTVDDSTAKITNPISWLKTWSNPERKIKIFDNEIVFQHLFFNDPFWYYLIILFLVSAILVFLVFVFEPTKDWVIGLKNEVTGEVKPKIYKLLGLAWVFNLGWELLIKLISICICPEQIPASKSKSDQIPNHALDLEWVNSNIDDKLEQGFIDLFVREYLEFVRDLDRAIIENATRLKRESLVIFYNGIQGSGKSSITNLMVDIKLMNANNLGINHKYDYFNKNQVALRKHLNPDNAQPDKQDIFVPSPYIYKFDTTQVQNTDNFTKAILDEIDFILHQNNILSENIINKYYDNITNKVDGLSWLKLLPIQKKPESISEQKEKISKKLNLFGKPIIIIIDEVDRLSPKQVYNLFNSLNFVCGFQNLVFVVNLDFELIKQTTCFEYLPVLRQSFEIVQGVYKLNKSPEYATSTRDKEIPESLFLNPIFKDQTTRLYLKYYQATISKKTSGYSVLSLLALPNQIPMLDIDKIKKLLKIAVGSSFEKDCLKIAKITEVVITPMKLGNHQYSYEEAITEFCHKNHGIIAEDQYLPDRLNSKISGTLYLIIYYLNSGKSHHLIDVNEMEINKKEEINNEIILKYLINQYLKQINYRQIIHNYKSTKS